MTEELEQTTELDENESTAEVVKTEKMFSDSEVQKMIKDRVTREKLATKKLADEWEATKADYEARVSSYEELLKRFMEEKISTQPESIKKLLNKLTVIEQWEYLSDPENSVPEKKRIPSTPKPQESEKKEQKSFGKLF